MPPRLRRPLIIFLASCLGILVYSMVETDQEAAKGLGILTFVAILWLTEAIHISATALLVPLLAVATGILTVKEALSNFANPIIYLFMGGFALAAALKTHYIDQWLARRVVTMAAGHLKLASLYLFGATAFISMWISNTATTAMMLPVMMGLTGKLDREKHGKTLVFMLLGVAYSANIGGIGTLVGSPPNAIAASILNMDFASWMKVGIPVVVILLPLTIGLLWLMLQPTFPDQDTEGKDFPAFKMSWTPQSIWVLVIFSIVVSLWLFSSQISGLLGITKDFDSFVAIGAVVLLLGSGLLSWNDFNHTTDWGVLLLFGGGITLSLVLSETHASLFLADSLVSWFKSVPPWVFLTLAIALMVFLTELASNTASAALLVPIFFSLPYEDTGVAPELLAIGVAIAASCAFMLPVATPPNALVFGTGLIQQKQMVKCGVLVNLLCICVLSLYLSLR
ncbi:Anion transporter [Hahella sp. CCB-MM4]|uniref:SLC13 family permease n=1 Tax=Hahella sp. (strain CCB-MM4) TaxID=1926491 RepID=UPI000B9C6671|nr:SLC13 family permease [Hahella sp. CCB-MM4]OZG70960.1 Anion transporter [Hahella sp. CCB-MM4]